MRIYRSNCTNYLLRQFCLLNQKFACHVSSLAQFGSQLVFVYGKSCEFHTKFHPPIPLQDMQLISAKFATMFVNFYIGLYTVSPQELRRARRTPDLWQVEGRLSSSSCQDRSWSCIDLNFPCMYILCKYKRSRESYLSNVIYIRQTEMYHDKENALKAPFIMEI